MTTTANSVPTELPSIGDMLSESWKLYVDRLWLLLTVGGIGAAASMLAVFLPFLGALIVTAFPPSPIVWVVGSLVAASAALWGASWAQIAMIEALLDPQNKPDWRQCYRLSWSKVVAFSWVGILFFVLVVGGLFAFVVPGMFLGVAMVFAPVVVVAEGLAGWPALRRSTELVSGRWGAVALRLFVAGLLSALPAKIPFIGWLLGGLATPFAMVAVIVVYTSLARLPAPEKEPGPLQTSVPVALAMVGLLILCGMSAFTFKTLYDKWPEVKAQLADMASHPPDPQKLQELLVKLQNGDSSASFTEAYQLIRASTAAAPGAPPPAQ